MRLLDYLSIETCRLCQIPIEQRQCDAVSLCHECWEPLFAQEVQSDLCITDGFGEIIVAHGVRYEESVKKLVYRLKYDKDRLIAEDLALLLNKAYLSLQLEPANAQGKPTLHMVPIPLSFWRNFKRGFNQAELLARNLARLNRLSIKTEYLSRVKQTHAQHDLSREERRLNLEGAFKAKLPEGSDIILVDDIHTSGATLAEAASTLYRAGAKRIIAITVARALLHQHSSPTRT